MDTVALRRQLRIKSGVVQRLAKENGLYRKEVEGLKTKHDKLIAQGAEDWDIRNADKMREESKKLVIDTETRLGKAAGELRDLVVAAKKLEELGEDQDLLKAEEVLELASS